MPVPDDAGRPPEPQGHRDAQDQPDFKPPRVSSWLIAVAIALLALVAVSLLAPADGEEVEELDYGAFLTRVTEDEVASVTINQESGTINGELTDGTEFTVQGPPGGMPEADIAVLDRHDVDRNYAPPPSDWWGRLFWLLPLGLIVLLWVWMARRARSQMGGLTSFTRSKARVTRAERPQTTFADVAGYDSVKAEISELVDFLRDPSKFATIGAQIPKGILLVGPPGTGKTLFARAIAGEARVPFISITGSEFLEMFVGVGAARVRDLFETARKETPAILFVDELDAIGRKRGTGLGGGHDEREQTLNQLLAEMDGFDTTEGIVMLAATNRPDILDPALTRAGRFDRQVVIPLPTSSEREAILRVHCKGKRLASDVDLDLVARGTPGMSGAELANLINEAALIAVRQQADEITAAHLDAARDRVVLGLERTSMVLSPDEKRTVAYHEAGHALLSEVLPYADPLHKVTILPVGMALGATQQMPVEERQIRRRPELEDALAVRLAGRAAEELVFSVASTGGHDDLVQATELARHMVREWGMSERLGHIAWGSQGPVFLGEELIHTRDYSDETARVIDEEVTRILDAQAERAARELARHRPALDAVATALLQHETLDASDVARIIHSASEAHMLTSEHAVPGSSAPPLGSDEPTPPDAPPARLPRSGGAREAR
jgi:cell division protease FtsH